MCLFGYVSWTFKVQKIQGKEILLPEFTSCCCLSEMLADLFSYPKPHFYLSENMYNGYYFPHITKIFQFFITFQSENHRR